MNLNNIEFEFMISGECLMRKQYHINSGTEKLILELSDINSIVAYQTWSSDTLLLNNKKRVVFSMLPENFYDVVKNYNAKYPDGKYMPTCVLKAGDEVMYMNVIDIYLNGEMMMDGSGSSSTDLDCLCSGGHSFSRGSLIMVADNNFTHLGKSVDGERISMNSFIDQNEVRSMNVNINLSALPYSDIDYNLEDRVYHPFMKIHRSHHFTKPAEKNTNRYKYNTYLTLHESLSKAPVEMSPQRTYNYIINDDAVIKSDKGGKFLVIDDPKMITAYQDWTKETRIFGQGKRLLHTIPAGDFVTEVAKINSHLKMGRQPMQPYKFTPTVYLEIKYPDKTVKTLAVIRDVEYDMSTSRADGQYSSNVTPQLIIRLNEYQMVDQEGNYISDVMRSNGEKVRVFMNIDDTPTKDYTDDNKSVSSINSKDLRSVYLNLGLVSLARLHNLNILDMHMFLGFYPHKIKFANDDNTNDPASSDQAVNSTFQISTPDLDTLLSNNRSSSDALGDKLLKGSVVANNKFASLNKKVLQRSVLKSKVRNGPSEETRGVPNIGQFSPSGTQTEMRIYVKVSNDDQNQPKFHFLKDSNETLSYENMAPNFGLTEGFDYVFDQSDSSNAGKQLFFTNDFRGFTNDQISINKYTRGISYTGTAGSTNDAATILIATKATFSTLYYYTNSNKQIGVQLPNSVNPSPQPAIVTIGPYVSPTNSGLNPVIIASIVGGSSAAIAALTGYMSYRAGLSKGAAADLGPVRSNPVYAAAKEGAEDAAGDAVVAKVARAGGDGGEIVYEPATGAAADAATAANTAGPTYSVVTGREARGLPPRASRASVRRATSEARGNSNSGTDPGYEAMEEDDDADIYAEPEELGKAIDETVSEVQKGLPARTVGSYRGVTEDDLDEDEAAYAEAADVLPGQFAGPAVNGSTPPELPPPNLPEKTFDFGGMEPKLTQDGRLVFPSQKKDLPDGTTDGEYNVDGVGDLAMTWDGAGRPLPKDAPAADSSWVDDYVERGHQAAVGMWNKGVYDGNALPRKLADDTQAALAESAANAEAAGVTESELDDLVNSVKKDASQWIPEGSDVSESDITSAMDSAESILKTEISKSVGGSIPTGAVQSTIKDQLTIAGVDSEYAEQIATGITSDISYASAVGDLNTIAEKGASAIQAAAVGDGGPAPGSLGESVDDFAKSFTPELTSDVAAARLSGAMTDASVSVTTQQVNEIMASNGITTPTTADIKSVTKDAFKTNLENGLQDSYGEASSLNLTNLSSKLVDTTYAANNIAAVTSAYEENVKSIIDKFSGELAASEFTSDSAQKILQGLQDPPASLKLEEATTQMNGKITDAVKSAIEKTPPPVDAQSSEGLSEYSSKIENSINEELTTSFGTWTTATGEDISVSALEGVGDNAASEAAGAVAKGAGEDAGSIIADLFG